MNEEEREIVKKFERLYLKDFNNEKITNEDRLSYIECVLMSNLIEKLQKENEELKEINNELEAEKNEAIRRYNFETIPKQKVKDKIRKNEEIIDISNDGDLIHELYQKNKVYEELLESEE